MKKNIILFLFSGLFLTLALSVPAQESDHNAVYFNLTKEYTLNPDGSMDYRLIKKQKLLTYRAFHNLYGETFIVYNPDFQQLKINEAYTIMEDGKKITVPANAFNEVLPGFAANAPAYNHLREMVVTHTGLERNAVIYLDYNVRTEKGAFPALMGNELLAENEPVDTLQIVVRIPKGQTLAYHTFHHSILPEKSEAGLFQIYTWKIKNIPAISSEEHQPGGFELYPHLIFSTFDNRQQAGAFLMGQPAFQYRLSETIQSEMDTLTRTTSKKTDLVLKLQQKVVNDFRLYPIPLKFASYRCRTVQEIWNSNGGTPLGKAVLLTALIRQTGIEAMPVGIIRTACFSEKLGTLSDIEEFAVKVNCKELGDPVVSVTNLNPVNLMQSMPGRTFMVFNPDGKVSFVQSEKPESTIAYAGAFIVSSDPKLTGEISISLTGESYPFLALTRDKNKIKNSVSGSIRGKDVTDIKESDLKLISGAQIFIVQCDHPFRKDSNFYYFSLPSVLTGIDGWGITTVSSRRETPFEIPSQGEETYRLSFTLPTGYDLFTPEKKVAIANKAGSFLWEVYRENGKLEIERKIEFSKQVISVQDYPDFKILMDHWNNPHYREIILIGGKE